jgi:hypothetical protein
MNEDVAKFWAECNSKISNVGSATNARKCRHKYMASDISDERYEAIFMIVAAEIRQALEATFDKWDITPEEREAFARVKKTRTPRMPKATDWAKQPAPKKAKKSSGLVIRDAEMPDEFDE